MISAVHVFGKTDKAAAYLWQALPVKLAARWPVLARHLADGRYIAQVPVFNFLLPVLLLAFGLFAGTTDRMGSFAVTGNIPVLMALLSIGIFSRHLGLWALCGFVLGDAFLYAYPAALPAFPLWISQLISWMFLYYLCIGFPFLARCLAGLPARFKLFSAPLMVFLGVALTEFWTQLAMITMRPFHTWLGRDDGIKLLNFAEEHEWEILGLHAHALTWVAFGAILARLLLEPFLARLLPSPPLALPPPAPARINWPLPALLKAGCFTLLMAGLFTKIWAALCFWLILSALIAGRSVISSAVPVARWDAVIARVLPVIRVILTYALAFGIAYLISDLLRDALGLRTMTVVATLLIITLAAGLMFWPPGRAVPFDALNNLLKWKRATTGLAVTFAMAAGTAFAHHCSFEPGCECLTDASALASLIASAGVFGVATGTILPGSYASTLGLMQGVEYRVSIGAYTPETGRSSKIVSQIKTVPPLDQIEPGGTDNLYPDAIQSTISPFDIIGIAGTSAKGAFIIGKVGIQKGFSFLADLGTKTSTKSIGKNAYLTAKEGGKHSTWYKIYQNKPSKEIQKGIKSIKKEIIEHKEKIKNPEKHYPDFKNFDTRRQDNLINKKWPSDIKRQEEQKGILEGILKERKLK